MVRFYLHIHDRNRFIPDGEGIECERLEEAYKRACDIIAELIRDDAWSPNSHGGRYVVIEDAKGTLVRRVMLWEVAERLKR